MSRRSRFRAGLGTLAFAALTAAAAQSLASEEFPEAVQKALELPCTPACTLCHNTPKGGPEDTNLFGAAVVGARIKLANADDIPRVLTCLEGLSDGMDPNCGLTEPADVNGNGKADVADIREDMIEPVSGNKLCGATYGCGARVEPKGNLDGLAWLIGASSALMLFWAARRGRERSSKR